jgi:hypothetical protein
MVKQLLNIDNKFIDNILIMDNKSTCIDTTEYLKKTNCKVIFNTFNHPRISDVINSHIYENLPNIFITTDPDLELNQNLPKNFIEILIELSEKYEYGKVGFALDLSDSNQMYDDDNYHLKGKTIVSHEKQFWINKIENYQYELYKAQIDTTFCLYNKKYFRDSNFYDAIRVAGNFTCKHLPWYKNPKIFTLYENYLLYKKTNMSISSIANLVIPYVENNFIKIYKNQEFFLIDNLDYNKNIKYFDNDTEVINKYSIFDTYLNKNKIMINIGSEIGLEGMYASRKSQQVYCLETNIELLDFIKKNFQNNCENNFTFLNKIDDINNTNINMANVSLINVSLNGKEEFFIRYLYDIHKTYNIPLYINLNFILWSDKNLDRFDFLTQQQKNVIINNSQAILFS